MHGFVCKQFCMGIFSARPVCMHGYTCVYARQSGNTSRDDYVTEGVAL